MNKLKVQNCEACTTSTEGCSVSHKGWGTANRVEATTVRTQRSRGLHGKTVAPQVQTSCTNSAPQTVPAHQNPVNTVGMATTVRKQKQVEGPKSCIAHCNPPHVFDFQQCFEHCQSTVRALWTLCTSLQHPLSRDTVRKQKQGRSKILHHLLRGVTPTLGPPQ